MGSIVWVAAGYGLFLSMAGIVAAVRNRNRRWRGTDLGFAVGALALLVVFTYLALGSLDSLLVRMHTVGIADRGLLAITGVGASQGADLIAESAVRWANWYRQAAAGYVARPSAVLWTYLVLDSLVFVPAYVSFLAIIRWRSATLESQTETEDHPTPLVLRRSAFWRLFRRIGIPILLAVADLTENVLTEVYVRRPLRALELMVAAPGAEPATQSGATVNVGNQELAISQAGSVWVNIATGLKWILLIILVLNTIPALVVVYQRARLAGVTKRVAREVFRVRGLIALVAVFGLIATMQLQVPDVIRRWSWREALTAGIAAVLFGIVAWVWANRILPARRDDTRQVTKRQLLWAMVPVGIAVAVGFHGLGVPLFFLGLLWLLDGLGPPGTQPTVAEEETRDVLPLPLEPKPAIPRILAAAPVILLGVGALRASLTEAIFQHPDQAWPTLAVLSLAGVLPIAIGMALWIGLRHDRVAAIVKSEGSACAREARPDWVVWLAPKLRLVGIAAALVVVLRVWAAPWSFSQALGALALVATFFAIAAAIVGALSVWAERVPPPRAILGLGFSKTPVFILLLLWLVVAGLVEHAGPHDVRVDLAREASHGTPITVTGAKDAWLARNVPGPGSDDAPTPIPMLFVAANGGGIKAATWAALGLDCVLRGGEALREKTQRLCGQITEIGDDRTANVFAMSGVSGGSLGLIEFIAQELSPRPTSADGWIRDALGDDFVSPSLSWQLFVEVPRSLLMFHLDMDRAEVLERGWERGWLKPEDKGGLVAALFTHDGDIASPLQAPFLTTFSEHAADLPLVMLNGATVEDGCRFVVSPLSGDGTVTPTTPEGEAGRNCTGITRLEGQLPGDQIFADARDARHFFCGRTGSGSYTLGDVRFSTAALLSARFPFVSPAGRLPFCAGEEGSVHAVDGGYLDNSGGASIAEVWEVLEPEVVEFNLDPVNNACIVPYLILIDSGYGPNPAPKSDAVPELMMPLSGLFSSKDSRTIEGRNDAAMWFRQPVDGVVPRDRVATLYLRTQPGDQAPLGWSIDDTSISALEAQLQSNEDQLHEIDAWFDGGSAACAPKPV